MGRYNEGTRARAYIEHPEIVNENLWNEGMPENISSTSFDSLLISENCNSQILPESFGQTIWYCIHNNQSKCYLSPKVRLV